MSMRDYALCDHGLVLNGLVADKGLLEELADCDVIESQFSFTGEAFPLHDNGETDWGHGDSFNDETVYYVSVQRHPSFFKAAYPDMGALVRSMCRSYGQCRKADGRLPKLTADQVRLGLRAIQGTYYG